MYYYNYNSILNDYEVFSEMIIELVDEITEANRGENRRGYDDLIDMQDDLALKGYDELSDYVSKKANEVLYG